MNEVRYPKRYYKIQFSVLARDGFLILHFFLFWMPSRDHQKANHIYAVTRETGVSVAIMFVVVDVVVVNIATSTFVDDPTAFFLLLIRK